MKTLQESINELLPTDENPQRLYEDWHGWYRRTTGRAWTGYVSLCCGMPTLGAVPWGDCINPGEHGSTRSGA